MRKERQTGNEGGKESEKKGKGMGGKEWKEARKSKREKMSQAEDGKGWKRVERKGKG